MINKPNPGEKMVYKQACKSSSIQNKLDLGSFIGLVISLMWAWQINSYLAKTIINLEFVPHPNQIGLIINLIWV